METIYIYNGASRLTIPVTDSAERSHSLQQHNYVKLVWKSAENTPISANAYIEYEGQVFYALDDYFPTHKDGIYEYDIEFHAIEDTFNRPLFFRYVDILDQTTGKTTSWKEIEWSLNGNLKTIADIVITCLNRAYDNAYFELPPDSYTDTLLMSYSFSGNSIADALSTIAEQNETEWWIETTTEYANGKHKYILHFDKCEIGTTIELNDHYTEDANGVWQSGGLKSVLQSGNTNIIPQKLFVYGSERNIIKKTVEEETEGGKMNVSYDKKLRLPSIFPNGTKEHVIESAGVTLSLNDDSSISIGGINNHFEQFKIFDEVYPKMDMEVTAVSVQNPNSENPIYWLKGNRLKSITTESPVDGSINPGKLGLLIEGCTLMCTFSSGLLNGREFECAWRESSAEIGLIPIDENDVQIPSGVYKPNEGDTFILWNLAMPQSSITIAQNELCVEAINYIEELVTSITETDCTTEAEATRISGLNTKIKVGQRISVNSNVFRNGRLSSRIIKYSYKLTTPYDVNFTLASSRQTGRLATLENMIADVTHEVHAVNQVQQAISRRQWHDTEEMMSMLDSIQKQMVVVGDENNAFGTTCLLKYNDTKQLLVSEGYVLHQSFTDNDFNGQWNIDSFTRDMSAIDPDGKTPFYVFFVCPKSKETAEKGYTDVASALPMYDDYYVFILGILSSEFEGKRAFNQTNGITSIAGGNVTTNVIQDPGQRLIVDFANATITARNGATIKGAIQFEKGEGENDLGTVLENMGKDVQDAQNTAKETQESINNLEIGGVNLISNIPSKWEQGSFSENSAIGTDYAEVCNYNSTTRIRVKEPIEVKGNIYVKIHNSGYMAAFTQFNENKKYLGKNTFVGGHNDAPHTLHNDTRYICLILRKSDNTTITPDEISNVKIQLEQGDKATSYKPNDADIIEAKENILNGAMLINFDIDTSSDYNNVKFRPNSDDDKNLTTPLKANTEYVFSIESILLKNGSLTPTNIAIGIFDSSISTTKKVWAIPYTDNKLIYKLTTPSTILSTDVLLIYGGQNGATKGVGFTAFGVKFAEGNKYIPWEGTSAEQQALITLNNAMKGSTDIIGGLVLTNLIQLKNEEGDVVAGITGLTTANNAGEGDVFAWAGGSLSNAISGTIPVLLKRQGKGSKVGCLVVEDDDKVRVKTNNGSVLIDADGGITVYDGENSSEVEKIRILNENINSDYIKAESKNFSSGTTLPTFSSSPARMAYKSINVNKSKNVLIIKADSVKITASSSGKWVYKSGTSSVSHNTYVKLVLYNIDTGNIYKTIISKLYTQSYTVSAGGDYNNSVSYNSETDGAINIELRDLPIGKYQLRIIYENNNLIPSGGVITSGSGVSDVSLTLELSNAINVTYSESTPLTIIGNNGMIVRSNYLEYVYIEVGGDTVDMRIVGLPTLAPSEEGRLYNSGGTLKIS